MLLHAAPNHEASDTAVTNGAANDLCAPNPGQSPLPSNLAINYIAQLNVEGLKTSASSSVKYVRDVLEEHKLLFILLTETWLRDHVDAELSIDDYVLYRADRSRVRKRRGRNSGGVAAYVRSDIAVDLIFTYSSGVVEALCLNLTAINLIVCVVYRQPDDPGGGNRSTNEEFSTFVNKLNEEVSVLPAPTPKII